MSKEYSNISKINFNIGGNMNIEVYNYDKYGYSYPIEYFRFYEDSLILARYRYEWDFIERFSGEWETGEGECILRQARKHWRI